MRRSRSRAETDQRSRTWPEEKETPPSARMQSPSGTARATDQPRTPDTSDGGQEKASVDVPVRVLSLSSPPESWMQSHTNDEEHDSDQNAPVQGSPSDA